MGNDHMLSTRLIIIIIIVIIIIIIIEKVGNERPGESY